MEKRTNHIKLPSDFERIPNKIATGKDFDREILDNFIRAYSLLISYIIDNNALEEAHF
ncbi:3361_t:CDS:2 [Funneliformis caledonium]|uniref:3361_t:CDS:1 n=1 Tax=Funneliformis caledonium TaxID=1117310 RepID=A0A9N8V418_9GLOM|nr:3361_t:CDS:2 [Funneliformis caledonium]